MRNIFSSKPLSAKQAVIYMLICSAMWSIGGIFIKLIPWNPIVIAGLRSLISAVVVLIYIYYSGMKLTINKRNAFIGLFLFLTVALFVTATKLTTSANAIVLQYSSPIFIIILNAALYKQRPRRKELLVVLVAMGGIMLCFVKQFGNGSGSLLGDVLALLSGICVAAFFVFGNKTGSVDDSISAIFIGHAMTFLFSIPFLFIFPPQLTGMSITFILILGIIQLGIPYILYGRAIKTASPLVCSLVSMVEPILNPVWVFWGVGEFPSVFAILGGVIVIAVITVWSVSNIKEASKNTDSISKQ